MRNEESILVLNVGGGLIDYGARVCGLVRFELGILVVRFGAIGARYSLLDFSV